MRVSPGPELGAYDSLYVSAGGASAVLSCAGRLAAERARQLKILVVILFGEGDAGAALSSQAADTLHLDWIGEPQPRPSSLSFSEALSPRAVAPDSWLQQAAHALDELGQRTKARHIYLPLGVGGHAEHRWVHEAGLLAFPGGDGRDVLLYEDRPEAFVPGAVRIRLAQLGARLPPGAAPVKGASLLRLLFRFHRAPYVGSAVRGLPERFRTTGILAGQWFSSRGWRPLKAFGPRLQPVLHEVPPESWDSVRDLLTPTPADARNSGRWTSWSREYARGLGGGHAERYWLVLPPREIEGVVSPAQPAGVR